jgi:hypothetical protein
MTILDIADAEDAAADSYADIMGSDDDTSFIRADAAERRRLAAIIAEEEAKEEAEEKRLRLAIRQAKAKKRLDNP